MPVAISARNPITIAPNSNRRMRAPDTTVASVSGITMRRAYVISLALQSADALSEIKFRLEQRALQRLSSDRAAAVASHNFLIGRIPNVGITIVREIGATVQRYATGT